jgi:hypothetical protein
MWHAPEKAQGDIFVAIVSFPGRSGDLRALN